MIPWEKDMLPAWPIRRIFMELLVLVDNNTYIDVDAAGEPGADMHVIFDVYTEQDENFYRAILGEDEKPANDAAE